MKKVLFLFIVVGGLQLQAQKQIYKEINYKGQTISIALNDIDILELVSHDAPVIKLLMDAYAENPTNLIINERKNDIQVVGENQKLQPQVQKDKYCKEQPFFSSYKIIVPRNAVVEISYNNGNFRATHFIGNLKLYLNQGTVNFENIGGIIKVQQFSGNIIANLKNTAVSITSNRGKIMTDLKFENLEKTKSSLKGLYMKPLNEFQVHSIHANISLNRSLNQ